MSIVGKAFAADSESDRSLKSPLLTTDACPDSELEIEQSNGAAQLRDGCQRPNSGDWEICIKNEESKIQQYADCDSTLRPSSVSIFRVPSFLKVSTKSEAYVPKIVSLGPYHHGDEKLKSMEIHKVRALNRMMMRSNKRDFFRSALVKIWEDKDEIMNSYEEKYDSNPDNLVMMIRDGCFILEILRTLGGDEFPWAANVSKVYEPIFEENRIENTGFDILNDMLKLENQIPLIVLQSLLELENGSNDVTEFLAMVISSIVSMFNPFHLDDETNMPDEEHYVSLLQQLKLIVSPPECRHLLGALHSLIVFPERDNRKEQQVNSAASKGKDKVYQRIPSAVEIKNAGIKFKKSNSGCIGNIKFENGTIHLPPITITECTEVLFRNLVALELCKPSTEINSVIGYVSLMDELINCGEDVAVLTRNRILTHYLGSDEEVAKLFNGLCTGVALSQKDRRTLDELRNGVHNDYKFRLEKKFHLTEFLNENFSTPWKALALMGAVIGLVLTLVTTICSILAVTN